MNYVKKMNSLGIIKTNDERADTENNHLGFIFFIEKMLAALYGAAEKTILRRFHCGSSRINHDRRTELYEDFLNLF